MAVGNVHDDTDHLAFPEKHQHVDWRFVNANALRRAVGNWRVKHRVDIRAMRRRVLESEGVDICKDMARAVSERRITGYLAGNVVLEVSIASADVEHRRMLCKRAPFAPNISRMMFDSMQDYFETADLPESLICPHKGYDLSSMTPNCDGHVVCPLHSLKWDIVNRRMVRQ